MKNNIAEGKRITWTNTTGSAVVSGQLIRVGNLLAVASVNIANNGTGELCIGSVFEVPKKASDTITQGQALTWKASLAQLTNTPGTLASGDLGGVAVAWEAAAASSTTVKVFLPAIGSGTLTP